VLPEGLGKLEKFTHLGSRNRDLPARNTTLIFEINMAVARNFKHGLKTTLPQNI
jgi:hypothetical protein